MRILLSVVLTAAFTTPRSLAAVMEKRITYAEASAIAASNIAPALAATPTGAYASDDPNDSYYDLFQEETPEAVRTRVGLGPLGADILGPQNIPMEEQYPDLLAPPSTDAGTVLNSKWSFSQSHNRLQSGGWARQQTETDMPIATTMAGVNMRLTAGSIREMHWHTAAEWSYMLAGSARITAINADGRNYIQDIYPGDLWYFPAGIPHSIQALNDTNPEGCEFLLVFDNGAFSEDSTFMLSDWLAHTPKEVLAKNFHTDISMFNHIPENALYIFPAPVPPSIEVDCELADGPTGTTPSPYAFHLSQIPGTPLEGGSVKVVDSRTFTVSTTISAAEVTVNAGGLRELHWHPTQPEWTFFIEGEARITSFASSASARTFTYQAGDIAYIPPSYGHYVENIGNSTLKFLEIFNSPYYQDISLTQWLALTPPEMVSAHLQLPIDFVMSLNKTKAVVV
ncbi:oxalate oxidase [Dacryopinax primogenitus]|uniref:Oxalate oxidase n=1 Tax=Dacryopinax primogenitus (strain DJM 731) TaxID=1858805 RepID=M5FSP1_DACPD|nr:oxalate oxidase [Dacryopinax primogenitus]EJT98234.1 oxalate oxidase [Dacryopinax primogenitus]